MRPVLFVIGYLGFIKREASGLYTSAVSIELLHDFMLVHDDIIDKSDTRRGKPSMHKMLNNYLARYKEIKFNGQDLSIVVGDVMYAMAIDAFLKIKEAPQRKERALKQLIRAALYTGTGEFIELLAGTKSLKKITKADIYKIYDYKTAYYTFASPLAIGAILGGANEKEVKKLIRYGINLGRAFQIKDDILGMFGDEKKIGKPILTDLQEAKKTILIWQAYRNAAKKDRLAMRRILTKDKANKSDLLKVQEVVIKTGALDCVKKEMAKSIQAAQEAILSSKIKIKHKAFLKDYSEEILRL